MFKRQFKITSSFPWFALLAAAALLLSSKGIQADDSAPTTIRRFALIAGANDGGKKRVKLRYATRDAESVRKVLKNLGGVTRADTIMLKEPSRDGFEEGFVQMERKLERAAKAGTRLELLFYFSGHSDEQGLLLGNDHFAYKELKLLISRLPADVKIAVVDSCASGALTRKKGGVRKPPFLVDTSGQVKGFAILTSASANEAAQESDKVGGSFFTHYLVSGLRGAADTTRDRKVTLNEAYTYAFHETLARTESTQAGPQHPNYDFQLAGSGDLVLTDLRGTSALLQLAPGLDGRVFVRDAQGNLVVEINKPAGKPMALGLEPGSYEVTVEKPASAFKGNVALKKGSESKVSLASLEEVDLEKTTRRGEEPEEEQELRHRPVSMGLAPGVSTDGGADEPVLNNFSLNLVGWGDHLKGAEISSLGGIRSAHVAGLQIGGVFNYVGGNLIGASIGGVAEIVKGDQKGLLIGGIANVVGGSSYGLVLGGVSNVTGATGGLQVGGVTNIARGPGFGLSVGGVANIVAGDYKGLQVSGIAGITGGFTGIQLGGVANVNKGPALGFQLGGVANVNHGGAKALQVGGIANVNTGDSLGLQIGGIGNVNDDFVGAQIGGIGNLNRGKVRGFQLGGIFNVGKDVKGFQLGLVNIATEKMRGVQLGLVNYSKDGMIAPAYWASAAALVNVGLKMGTPYTYGILGYALDPLGDEKWSSYFYGLGGHIEFKLPMWLEIDALVHDIQKDHDWSHDELDLLIQVRATVGWRVIEQLSIFGGLTLNQTVSQVRENAGPGLSFNNHTSGDTHYSMSPGFTLGLQWEPHFGRHNQHDYTE